MCSDAPFGSVLSGAMVAIVIVADCLWLTQEFSGMFFTQATQSRALVEFHSFAHY
jgi:hypothetical protein